MRRLLHREKGLQVKAVTQGELFPVRGCYMERKLAGEGCYIVRKACRSRLLHREKNFQGEQV